jgi:P-type Cu+ transporter
VPTTVPKRRLTPSASLPDDRPRVAAEPCAACGADVDPLRAPRVLAFEDGVRVLCGEPCVELFRRGERSRVRPALGTSGRTPPGGRPRHRTPPSSVAPPSIPPAALLQRAQAALDPAAKRALALGALALSLAVLFGLFPRPELALVSATSSAVTTVIALRMGTRALKDVGLFAWLLGGAGAFGAAFAAYDAVARGSGGALGLIGAALAAAAMLVRAYLDTRAHAPIAQAVSELLARLPRQVHVPVQEAGEPSTIAVERKDASKVRTGEEIIAMKGHVLAVDGVVQAGEASVLPYPGATTTVRRKLADAVLAGATVTEGALRVLATRVGDDRGLVRVARFGDASERDAGPLVHLAAEAVRFGAPGSVLLALLAVVIAGDAGLTTPLAAASAVLIAAPLLALRRATQWTFVAGAASAGARGIVFQHGAALEQAGHVSMVAMAPHRTLTEGKPEVVEVCYMGDGNNTELLGIVAAAEQAVGAHPIARAIAAFASAQGVPVIDVRRAVGVPGHGVTAIGPSGEEVVIGNRRLLLDHGISVATADSDATRAETAGRMAIFVAVAGRVRALVILQDHLRVGARAAIQRMFDMDLEVVLLTGAQRGPIEELAAGLDIGHVKAELLPEERGDAVRSLREAGGRVAVIGYPFEDDAALAAADVGIALAAAGGTAGEKAVALVSEDVRDAAAALWIAHATRDAARSAALLSLVGFASVVAAAAAGLIEPAIAAVVSLAVDTYGVRAGTRLLHRIALRLPAWT